MTNFKGYGDSLYALSLQEFGEPRELKHCGGWILVRPIPGTPYKDAMGCYPLFSCENWPGVYDDLEDLGKDLVSLALVTDPFSELDPTYLLRCFKDVVLPFKEHYIADLNRPINEIVGRRHRKNALKALKNVQVEVCDATSFYDMWIRLFEILVEKHNIKGIKAFSKKAFAKQLSIPGTVILCARANGETVGAQIYFVSGGVAHCHLGAASQMGYDLGAIYAMDFYSIEYFSKKVHFLNLGGGAGIKCDGNDGLSMYKKGWSTETRRTYFCGRIFNMDKYLEIVKAKGIDSKEYFPAYRKGEFE